MSYKGNQAIAAEGSSDISIRTPESEAARINETAPSGASGQSESRCADSSLSSERDASPPEKTKCTVCEDTLSIVQGVSMETVNSPGRINANWSDAPELYHLLKIANCSDFDCIIYNLLIRRGGKDFADGAARQLNLAPCNDSVIAALRDSADARWLEGV